MVTDYGKLRVGSKSLNDAVLDLGALKYANKNYSNKKMVLKALGDRDINTLRAISKYFYATSGIYLRTCELFANLYRYDWYVVPEIYDEKVAAEKVVKEFNKTLNYLDNSYIKRLCGHIAQKVIVEGAYYGYCLPNDTKIIIQDLPIEYCRSRYFVGNKPAVEFNLKFFDEKFSDIGQRMKVIKMFPKDIQIGYVLFKQNKLTDESGRNSNGWYLLDPENTIKFNFNNGDVPLFVNAIPAILDLDAAQELDRRKQMQNLIKIIVQKLPRDKNGDLIFDIDEAIDLHQNMVEMLQNAIGTDALTTFADIDSIDLSDRNTSAATDNLTKMERTVYNAFGISSNLFNTDGNLSLEKSILNDEAMLRDLLLQFNAFFDNIVQARQGSNKKKYLFRLYMLETTQYNYRELSKMYKEQTTIGYSKMLPQIALGHSQSSIINMAYFENEILHLSQIMIPPLMSSTINSDDVLGKTDKEKVAKTQVQTEENKGGRPELAEDQKSEKTIANQESMS